MLIVKELTASKTLDRNAMASVAGGYRWPGFPFKEVYKLDQRFSANVELLQGNTQTLVN
jgi:hypothetical protein